MTSELTERELEVLVLMARGLGNRAIGEKLYISSQTVTTHAKKIYRRLGVRSRTEAVHVAHERGILRPRPNLRLVSNVATPFLKPEIGPEAPITIVMSGPLADLVLGTDSSLHAKLRTIFATIFVGLKNQTVSLELLNDEDAAVVQIRPLSAPPSAS